MKSLQTSLQFSPRSHQLIDNKFKGFTQTVKCVKRVLGYHGNDPLTLICVTAARLQPKMTLDSLLQIETRDGREAS